MFKQSTGRPAIAMIELIFAIVIIGITLMSAPMLMQQASKSGYVTIQQESINEVAAKINMILGYHWDENSSDPTILDPILVVNGDAGLLEGLDSEGNGTGIRIGTPIESYRSFIDPDGNRIGATAWGALGPDGADEDDVDDFAGAGGLIEVEASASDYIEGNTTISINTTVAYISDAPTAGAYNSNALSFNPNFTQTLNTTSNIKRISTTLTSTSGVDELDKTIILHAFSCNIGGYQLEERDF